jgi:hypothetical protein
MKCAVALVALMLSSGIAAAETPVTEVSQLRIYSTFWQNLHHFLYVSAWATRPVVPRAPRLAMPLPQEPVVSLTAEGKASWNAAVTYYDRNIASKDLLFDDGLTRIKVALADADDRLTNVPIDEALRSTLLEAAPIYRKYWRSASGSFRSANDGRRALLNGSSQPRQYRKFQSPAGNRNL